MHNMQEAQPSTKVWPTQCPDTPPHRQLTGHKHHASASTCHMSDMTELHVSCSAHIETSRGIASTLGSHDHDRRSCMQPTLMHATTQPRHMQPSSFAHGRYTHNTINACRMQIGGHRRLKLQCQLHVRSS
jgi:hypothetical protein